MSDAAAPLPPPSADLISVFNNLISYLKSKTVVDSDESTRNDVENVIASSELLLSYLSNNKKKDEITPPVVPESEIRIGVNEINRDSGRTIYFKMKPETAFQKVFSTFVKRMIFANGDESHELEVRDDILVLTFFYHF
jgi:hypothetical protein